MRIFNSTLLIGALMLVGHLGGSDALAIRRDNSNERDISIETTTEIDDDFSIQDDRSIETAHSSQHLVVARNIAAVSAPAASAPVAASSSGSQVMRDELSRRLIAHQRQKMLNRQSGQVNAAGQDHSLEDVAEQFINETNMSVVEAQQVLDQVDLLDNLSTEDTSDSRRNQQSAVAQQQKQPVARKVAAVAAPAAAVAPVPSSSSGSQVLRDELSRRLIAHQRQKALNRQNGQVNAAGQDHSLEDVAEQFINETNMPVAEAQQVMDQVDLLDNLSTEDTRDSRRNQQSTAAQQPAAGQHSGAASNGRQSDETLDDNSRERDLDDQNDNQARQVPDDWFLVRQYLDEFYSWALQDDLAREYFWTPVKSTSADPAVVDHPLKLTQAVIQG